MNRRPSSRRRAALALAALAAVCFPHRAAAQEPAPEPPRPEPAWPELPKSKVQRIKDLAKTLRTTKKPTVAARTEAEFIALGSGAAPHALERLSDYRVNINDALRRVLDAVTTADHAPLLARHARDKKAAVRLYVLQRLASFKRPDLAPVFRVGLKDRDQAVAFQAALGLTSTGDLGAMETVFARCIRDWREVSGPASDALAGARGRAASAWVFKRMADSGEESVIAGLRVLRSVGDEEAAGAVRRYLDSESHSVKKAAINALRAIVDGDPPREKLSVFQAIDLAKKWKKRAL